MNTENESKTDEFEDMRWHHGAGYLCAGTFRIARADFEYQVFAADNGRERLFDWMCNKLNTPPPQPTPADSTTDEIIQRMATAYAGECGQLASLYGMRAAVKLLREYDAKQQGAGVFPDPFDYSLGIAPSQPPPEVAGVPMPLGSDDMNKRWRYCVERGMFPTKWVQRHPFPKLMGWTFDKFDPGADYFPTAEACVDAAIKAKADV